jgi:mono/diheme cytochrome c family protein
MRSPRTSVMVALIVAVAAGATMVTAQEPQIGRPSVGFGTPITEQAIAPWNIDVRTSDGKGLPPGRGTAAEGKTVYDAKCLACHGDKAAGGSVYGAMVGGIGSFTTKTRVLTPGSMYPYAPILFDYTRRAMPMDKPLTLTNDEVYALAAYILALNGLIPDTAVMDAESLPKVKMPNRDGFIPDTRPDVKATRCMTDCPPIGVVK